MKRSYVPGKWLAICDVCGFEYFNDELIDRWDGFKVCRKDWEPRHPQERVRAKVEHTTVPWTRLEPPDVFVPVTYVFNFYFYADYIDDDYTEEGA